MLVMSPSSVLDVDEAIIAVDVLQLQDGTRTAHRQQRQVPDDPRPPHHDRRQHVDHVGIHRAAVTRPARAPGRRDRDEPQPHAVCAHSVLLRRRRRCRRRLSDCFRPRLIGRRCPDRRDLVAGRRCAPGVRAQGRRTGGIGQQGGAGGDGGNGAKGADSYAVHRTVYDQPGYGGDGGRGGAGRDGGTGGRRWTRWLRRRCISPTPSTKRCSRPGLALDLGGGDGGVGGQGGRRRPAAGSVVRPATPANVLCTSPNVPVTTATTAPTATGDRTGRGVRSYGEDDCRTSTPIVITEDEFRAKWTAPQIRTVDPFEAEVGETVTIEGRQLHGLGVGQDRRRPRRHDGLRRHDPAGRRTADRQRVAARYSSRSQAARRAIRPRSRCSPSLSAATPNPAAVGDAAHAHWERTSSAGAT